jgi:hypothetical protein
VVNAEAEIGAQGVKQCRFCGIAIDDAVTCPWCGSDVRTAAPESGRVSPMAPRWTLGRIYGTVTAVLIATVFVSGWCWGSQNASGISNVGLRDACLGIWAIAGVLLTLSQFVFVVMAIKAKEASARTAVLVIGLAILAVIALFVVALANMPS